MLILYFDEPRNSPIMHHLFLLLTFGVVLFCASCNQHTKSEISVASDDTLSQLSDSVTMCINQLINNNYSNYDSAMVSVAVYLNKDGEHLIDTAYFFSNNNNPLPNESTIFHMGSVTKTFTAAMLAIQATKGQINLNESVQDYLPVKNGSGYPRLPSKFENQSVTISLGELASMNSGLSRNAPVIDGTTPYDSTFTFLENTELNFLPGSDCYIYSNLGYAVCGLVLSHQSYPGVADYYNYYEQVVIDSLLSPLMMNDTRITLTDDKKKRRAQGYYANNTKANPVSAYWPTNLAAGGLYSTTADMKIYTRAMLGQSQILSQSVIDTLLTPRGNVWADTCKTKNRIPIAREGMAWVTNNDITINDSSISRFSKDGAIAGFSTYITFSTPTVDGHHYKAAVVLWANKQGISVEYFTKKILQTIYDLD